MDKDRAIPNIQLDLPRKATLVDERLRNANSARITDRDQCRLHARTVITLWLLARVSSDFATCQGPNAATVAATAGTVHPPARLTNTVVVSRGRSDPVAPGGREACRMAGERLAPRGDRTAYGQAAPSWRLWCTARGPRAPLPRREPARLRTGLSVVVLRAGSPVRCGGSRLLSFFTVATRSAGQDRQRFKHDR